MYVQVGCTVSVRNEVRVTRLGPRPVEVTSCASVSSGVDAVDSIDETFRMSSEPAGWKKIDEHNRGRVEVVR